MNLSIIMAYKPDGGIRDRHCKWTAARYKKMFPEAEIIISTDQKSKKEDGWDTFCKSKYINAGVEKAKNNNILITDIDVVFVKNVILKGLKHIDDHCAVLPFSKIYYLNRDRTEEILNSMPRWQMPRINPAQHKKRIRIGLKPNGMHLLTKKAWAKSGGYDERYTGWGSEDSAFLWSLVTMNQKEILRLDADCYHLWHPLDRTRHRKRDERVSELTQRYLSAKFNPYEMAKILKEEGRRQHVDNSCHTSKNGQQ